MPKPKVEGLEEYKAYVKKRLAQITPILQRTSVGDFSVKVDIPEKEDEFSELLIGLDLMMDDLRELDKLKKEREKEKEERLTSLENWRKMTMGRELKMAELKERIAKLEKELDRKTASPTNAQPNL
jgi:hypothetical protein